jgi:hypothetical protein
MGDEKIALLKNEAIHWQNSLNRNLDAYFT